MTSSIDEFVTPATKFDHLNRYLVADPQTGEIRPHTRTSTLVEVLSDRRGLEKWEQRNILQGLALQPDLLEGVAEADNKLLSNKIDGALAASGAYAKRDAGTAVHEWTERLDRGEIGIGDVPAEYRRLVARYVAIKAEHGIEIVPGWIERVVVNPHLNVAGTVDRLVRMPRYQLPVICDIKTGANAVRLGQMEVAAQLAVYATATHWWEDGALYPMPEIDKERGVVIHLPVEVS